MYTACDLGRWFRHTEYMAGVMASRSRPHPLLVAHLGQCIAALRGAASAYLHNVPSALDVETIVRRTQALIQNFNLHEAVQASAVHFDLDMDPYSSDNEPMVTFMELGRWKFHLVHMVGTLVMMEAIPGVQPTEVRRLRAYIASSAQMLVREIEAYRMPVQAGAPACPMKVHDRQTLYRQAIAIANQTLAN